MSEHSAITTDALLLKDTDALKHFRKDWNQAVSNHKRNRFKVKSGGQSKRQSKPEPKSGTYEVLQCANKMLQSMTGGCLH